MAVKPSNLHWMLPCWSGFFWIRTYNSHLGSITSIGLLPNSENTLLKLNLYFKMQPKKRKKEKDSNSQEKWEHTINKKKNKRYQATVKVPSIRIPHHHANNLTRRAHQPWYSVSNIWLYTCKYKEKEHERGTDHYKILFDLTTNTAYNRCKR